MIVKNKIVSYRTCLYTNKQFEKSQLIKLVKINNKLTIDKNQNMPGRGYWLHITAEALKDPKLIQILSKRAKCIVDQDLIKELSNYEKK